MRVGGPAYWALVAVTLAVLGAMMVWTFPAIHAGADGLRAFDLRPRGYDLAEAQVYLAALSAEGRAVYTGPQALLDTLYPPLLFACLALALWHLSAGLWTGLRLALLAVAALGMAADLLENAAVRAMLAAGPDGVTADLAARASLLTVTKYTANSAGFLFLIGLAARRIWRRRIAR